MSGNPVNQVISSPSNQAPWWFLDYRAPWFRLDLLAGLTAAAVVVPKAMAYAGIAGLPVQVGLYMALTPMVVYAVLGTSRPLSVSTTSTIAMLTAAELALVAPGGAPAELTTVAATLAAFNPSALDVISKAPLGPTLGNERMFFTLTLAVEKYLSEEADAGSGRSVARKAP